MVFEADFQQALGYHQAGKLAEARAAYEQCLALHPNNPNTLINLGSLYSSLQDHELALRCLHRAIALRPQDPAAHYNLGNALRLTGDLAAAIESYRKALEYNPNDAKAWHNLSLTFLQSNRYREAIESASRSIDLDAGQLEPRLNLANAYGALGEISAAQQALEDLLACWPDHPAALNNLATLQQDTGQIEAALTTLQRAVALQPELPQPRHNLLMGLQYNPATTANDLLNRAREWGAWAMTRVKNENALPKPVPRSGENRPLRIGYVSADLCMHPVGLFLREVIAAHDPAAVTPVIYSTGSPRDHLFAALVTAVQEKGGGVREVKELDDPTLATQIRADAIDILIDLSGHTGKSRLAAFAWKPALLQISWLGYFATTGLSTVDFVILDPYHAPEGTEAQFCEGIIRLPHNRLCYSSVSFAPEVALPPFEKNGFITFGSFNNTAKLNDAVLDAWARILKAVPNSRLILKWRTFADGPFSERIRSFFTSRGIAGERIELRPMSVHRELLEQYADIDIALDPFPFSGGHTSCEALWMGVPVVTLPQERVVSRQTWSFLSNIGLPGLAAQDIDGYVQLAVGLANSRDTLKGLRGTLRERMGNSPLCDVQGFTRLLESAYRKAWEAKYPNLPAPAQANQPETTATDFVKRIQARATVLMAQLRADAEQPDLWLELTELLAKLLRHDAVVASANEVLQRRPDDLAALTLKGNALRVSGKVDEALPCYRRVLELRPQSAEGYCNLGAGFQTLGRYTEAIEAYHQAVSLKPGNPAFWGNLSVSLTYSPSHTPGDTLAALQRFDAQVARPLRDPRPYGNDRNPDRCLKVGYVSPDFRKHAVAYFALPLLEGHHRDQVEVTCYYNHRQDDDWTAAFRQAADHWLDCAGMGDAELAERIRADGIDILVDLAGHTENNRLLTFARKPAPVQVTWMGYVTTTGMSAMDWRVTHLDADPQGTDAHYREKLYRLPGTMWCFRPLPGMPEVSPPPMERNGYLTFGSFNRYSKNSAMVLEAWAEILQRVPDSRLVICVPEGEIRQQMARFFNERGIAPERIAAFAKLSHEDFWKLHGEVDIALDPFPFGGGTTTCESLWLGVPVVSLTGKEDGDFAPRFASRMGFAFLNNIDAADLACESVADYINTAIALAQDPTRLTALRQTLRERMARAPITDEARFVREMEAAYRAMWQDWCCGANNLEVATQCLCK